MALPIIPLAPFTTSTPPPPSSSSSTTIPTILRRPVRPCAHARVNKWKLGFECRRSIPTPRCTLVITRARSHTRPSRPHILYGSRNVRQRTRAPQFNPRRRACNLTDGGISVLFFYVKRRNIASSFFFFLKS